MSADRKRMLACLSGGMAGDAAGALLEGRTSIDDSTARKAIAMLPGGSRSDDVQLSPGQITDDGELMLMLLDGIATSAMEPSMGFPANEVASNYVAWYASRPFSCGQATHNAFGKYAYASSSISTEMKKVYYSQIGRRGECPINTCTRLYVTMEFESNNPNLITPISGCFHPVIYLRPNGGI